MRQPEPGTMQYSKFISEIDNGNIKIPQFQREFVWSKERAAKLLDSILKGYPIGTFILWKTKERLRSIRNLGNISLPDTKEGDFVYYILDGQQRITSIYASIKGETITRPNEREEDFSKIFIDLERADDDDKDIVITQVEEREDNTYISIQELLHSSLRALVDKYNDEYLSRIDEYRDKLNSYLFSNITIQDAPIDIATEIFTRINEGGKPLSVFEIMCAKTYDDQIFDLAQNYDILIKRWSECNYDTISSSTILQAVSVCLVKDCTKKSILSLNKSSFITNWNSVISALEHAIDYFRTYYKIPVSQLLPYDGLLVPFTYFFYHHPNKPMGFQKEYLEDYFWRTTLTSRFSNALETKIGQDIKKIDDIINNTVPVYSEGVDISEEALTNNGYFSVGKAYIKGFLCILAAKTPLSFNDNSKIIIDNSWLKQANSKNYHHFFPRSYLRRQNVDDFWANHIANIVIVDDFLNKRIIRDKSPAKYMADFKKQNSELDSTMKTHLIKDMDKFGISKNDYDLFFDKRIAEFAKEFRKRIKPADNDRV